MLKAHPLQSLFSSSHLSKDGRVIAKCPGMDWSNTNSEAYHAVIWSQMVKSYSLELGVSVQGLILPALEVIVREHRLRQNDFISLADQSPIVPQNRDSLFGKGLFLGYEQDFVTALHILVPQIENMVRYHLKAAGVKTTNLDSAGIENENGLSALVELTAVGQVFGEDCAFELKALFCDPFGPNLRNELAHGLLGYGDCQSVYSVYAWWFALRLVTITFWNSIRKPNTADATETPENKE
jgi:hypothetical protein